MQLRQNARVNLDGSTEMDFATCFQGIKPMFFQKTTFENGLFFSIFTERSKTESIFIIIPVIKLKSINSSGPINPII